MDHYIATGQGDRDPYWCDVWPAAVAMAERLDTAGIQGTSVIDLGCGLGLPGIASALQGAASVRFLDQEPLALQCAMLSATLQGLAVPASVWRVVGRPSTELWAAVQEQGDPAPPGTAVHPSRTAVRTPAAIAARVFDWRKDPVPEPAQAVLACDVLYEAAFVKALLQALTDPASGNLAVKELRRTSVQSGGPPAVEVQVFKLQPRQPGDTIELPWQHQAA